MSDELLWTLYVVIVILLTAGSIRGYGIDKVLRWLCHAARQHLTE